MNGENHDHLDLDGDGAVFGPSPTPEHGPDFWNALDDSLRATPPVGGEVQHGSARDDRTEALPSVAAGSGDRTTVAPITRAAPAPAPRRLLLPLAAAAALVVLVGFGFVLANRGGDDPARTTDVVAGPTEVADAANLDGPDDGEPNAGVEATPGPDTESTPAAQTGSAVPAATPSATTDTSTDETSTDETSSEDSPTPAPTTLPVASIPDFDAAFGVDDEPDYLPLDQGVPEGGTFLGNWSELALTFYGVTADDTTCAAADHSEIRYVNGSGLTQDVHDPQLRFSGEIHHLTIQNDLRHAAWVVSCGNQLELFVAEMEPTGRIADLTLAWFGEGVVESALVLWDGTEVNLNAIEPGRSAFAVAYDIETELVSRNGGPSRIMIEAGAPAQRSLTPLAASPDAGLTYFTGTADPGTESRCEELAGSGRSDMLWLRQGEGLWQPAVEGDFPLGTVTAAAIEPEFLQFAFADVCPRQSGRVVTGTQLPDGRIGDVRTLDMTAYVPGFVSGLFWVDDNTLRIETDNTEYGFDTVRFDYRLDERIVVQLG